MGPRSAKSYPKPFVKPPASIHAGFMNIVHLHDEGHCTRIVQPLAIEKSAIGR
jgi:hypothetical protein